MTFFQKFKLAMTAAFVASFYWFYSRFWRVRHLNLPPAEEPVVFAHWHGDELLLIGANVRAKMAVMASLSRDGELLKRVLGWMGFRVVRGSSSRAGVLGLKGLIDVVQKEKCDASLAVDGPRGPIYRVKPGVLKLAQQTRCRLVPAASAARSKFIFKNAWNQCYLPLPFSKCVVVYGEGTKVPENSTTEDLEMFRVQLEAELRTIKQQAESFVNL